MGWLSNILARTKEILRYVPMAWMGIKILWACYRSKIKQEGFRDALESERKRRIQAERDRDIERRLAGTMDERRERIRKEAELREKARSD